MVNKKEDGQAKSKRLSDVINKRMPDRVPSFILAQTYAIRFNGFSVKKALMGEEDCLFNSYDKYLEEVYADLLTDVSLSSNYRITDRLGGGQYVLTDEGTQVVGGKGEVMHEDEYDLFNSDPWGFLMNVYIPRKFPIFNSLNVDEKAKLLSECFNDFYSDTQLMFSTINRLTDKYAIPFIGAGSMNLPADVILDYLRDFVGTMKDIKRRPDKVYEACQTIYDMNMKMFLSNNMDPKSDKCIYSPLHIPTYLNLRDYEKIYHPFMKKYIQEMAVDRGYALWLHMESHWKAYIDFLKDLPKEARVTMLFEGNAEEAKFFKDELGDHFVIMGGMSDEKLKLGTVQECKDEVDKCMQLLAPGGNYIFSNSVTLISESDAKKENVIETAWYAHEVGKY